MAKEKPAKDAEIKIRLPQEEKDAFTAICDRDAVNASEIIRRLLADYVKSNS
ncbi:ribbon-helix-helix protein, CopG family [Anaeroselena agilis]|uniref:Ribbon-helix-helix protein, CopG family n=1 Tax=Anaeroselena agilis TaxID=3063788 RepID=A0ABU3NW27_9FIRM|nr:ribbon-helix-helix protein, CopG family [Selenomonadales bacterium 4137-cl]